MIKLSDANILNQQSDFYKKGKAGCMFAAIAAKDFDKYAWKQQIIKNVNAEEIDKTIHEAEKDLNTSTLSLIFPTISCVTELLSFLYVLEQCSCITTEKQYYQNHLCYGFRVSIGQKNSWVTGFGPFDFFPTTRRSPFTEISFRIKDRPDYDWVMKKSPENVLHLADMDMKGIPKNDFKKLWQSSLNNTEKILGHKPDFISAAKTTFSIPLNFIHEDR